MTIVIDDRFEVAAPLEQVWGYFEDPRLVVPCLPGAELLGVLDDGTYEGRVRFQVGPMRALFVGTVKLEETDPQAHMMTFSARGTQQGAVGRATAEMQFACRSLGDSRTEVSIHADVSIAGKLAQLGGGMIQSVARQVFRKFAECARRKLLGDGPVAGA